MGIHLGLPIMRKTEIESLSTGINIWEYEGGYSYHGKKHPD